MSSIRPARPKACTASAAILMPRRLNALEGTILLTGATRTPLGWGSVWSMCHSFHSSPACYKPPPGPLYALTANLFTQIYTTILQKNWNHLETSDMLTINLPRRSMPQCCQWFVTSQRQATAWHGSLCPWDWPCSGWLYARLPQCHSRLAQWSSTLIDLHDSFTAQMSKSSRRILCQNSEDATVISRPAW